MARRTVYLPEAIETIAREASEAGESFSATVSRLIEEGARATRGRRRPSYVGSGDTRSVGAPFLPARCGRRSRPMPTDRTWNVERPDPRSSPEPP